ncbi:PREDICTED: uncharacterized protein LOC105854407 [Condylura cristata]|uniref:uncharacterized protein LOC105854407 n=1 Tax=Condylura cristata TaxID=143302 RepID=UPI00064340E0|nr:PREDICTED: uncharacterized protein LOC105854407 [Condylura cristata]
MLPEVPVRARSTGNLGLGIPLLAWEQNYSQTALLTAMGSGWNGIRTSPPKSARTAEPDNTVPVLPASWLSRSFQGRGARAEEQETHWGLRETGLGPESPGLGGWVPPKVNVSSSCPLPSPRTGLFLGEREPPAVFHSGLTELCRRKTPESWSLRSPCGHSKDRVERGGCSLTSLPACQPAVPQARASLASAASPTAASPARGVSEGQGHVAWAGHVRSAGACC